NRSEFSIFGKIGGPIHSCLHSATRPGSIRIAPHIKIVDLSHNISPQNIREVALILHRSFPDISQGTIPVIVVNPSAGTQRRSITAF
ncbi:MAG: SAM-dependent chlorinase/fluorinase, partial [Anaerolineales bacterium]|nr:SAM-dependent chlorinase/fluorinase [Anaerolineales bacterium]